LKRGFDSADDHLGTARVKLDIGNMLLDFHVDAEAEKWMERGYKEYSAASPKWFADPLEKYRALANICNYLASCTEAQEKYKDAAMWYGKALDNLRQAYGPHGKDLNTTLLNAISLDIRCGRPQLAIPLLKQVQSITQRDYGSGSSKAADVWRQLGEAYFMQGDFKEAEAAFKHDIEICQALEGPNSAMFASQLMAFSKILRVKGRYAEGEELFERVLKIVREHPGENCVYLTDALDEHGQLLMKQGKFAAAEDSLKEALSLRKTHARRPGRQLAIVMHLCECLLAQGKKSEAAAIYKDCPIDILKTFNNVVQLKEYARVLVGIGRTDEMNRVEPRIRALSTL
jgi:tetratricopeptide (TPR) repeat protein